MSDSNSLYACVRSNQNVLDKVGLLEDNTENVITEELLMAVKLNEHFSSVFSREDISAMPTPVNKSNGQKT